MAAPKTPKEDTTPKADVVLEGANNDAPDAPHVTLHLDKDLNDPRNAAPTPTLPSLNDPGQS